MKTTSKNKGNGIDADVSGNRLPFKSQSINNFCGIDISQPTPSESLSVPLFSLGESESSIENNPLSRLPMQFLWENDSASKFKDVLRSPDLQMLIRDYLDDDNSFLDVNTRLKKSGEHANLSS